MKRKVIQIANSTQLVSLPRKWTPKYGIKKGEEIEVEEKGNKIILTSEKSYQPNKKEIDAEKYGLMLPRCIFALYKQGVDEVKLNFSSKATLKRIQDSLGKETLGYEIIDQGEHYCIIKSVTGNLEDFNSILRRTFLMLMSMANDSLNYIKKQEYKHLKSVAFLELSNNRFTTTCRRLLNKKGSNEYEYVGPLYYIIEDLENLADEYKYLCTDLSEIDGKKFKVNPDVMDIYETTNNMLRTFYELFYKFDESKVAELAQQRKEITSKAVELFEKNIDGWNYYVLHRQMVIMQKIFCLVGPYVVLVL